MSYGLEHKSGFMVSQTVLTKIAGKGDEFICLPSKQTFAIPSGCTAPQESLQLLPVLKWKGLAENYLLIGLAISRAGSLLQGNAFQM